MGEGDHEYPYRAKLWVVLLCGGFFAAGAAGLGSIAAQNDRGVVINGVVELGPGGATAFYWALAAAGAAFVALMGVVLVHRFASRQRLLLGPAALACPAAHWSNREQQIDYEDIMSVVTQTMNGERFLHVQHAGGRFTVTARMMPSRAAFDEFTAILVERVAAARAALPAGHPPADLRG